MLTTLLGSTINISLESQAEQQQLAGTQFDGFGGFLSQILTFVLTIAALLLLLYLIWGAVNWISAGGDNSKVQKARDQITQAVIGLVVLLSTLAIFNLLQTFFGFEVLTFDRSNQDRNNQALERAQQLQNSAGQTPQSFISGEEAQQQGNQPLGDLFRQRLGF